MNWFKRIYCREITVGVLSILSLFAVLLFMPPIHQWPEYNQFSDTREAFGIPNFWNVISNVLFCLVSVAGVMSLRHKLEAKRLSVKEAVVFLTIFIGIFLTGIGSAYYHLNPNNVTLVWDRIPMTIVFMSLLSLTIMEKIYFNVGFFLLPPLLIFGVTSVWYWCWTDDLRLYGFVQFYSIFLVICILYFFKKPYPPLAAYVWMFIFYGIAKGFEMLDMSVYGLSGGMISGHMLKHVAAAISAYWIVVMLNSKN